MPYQTIHGVPVFGDPLFNAVEQMEKLVAPTAERGGDGRPGYV